VAAGAPTAAVRRDPLRRPERPLDPELEAAYFAALPDDGGGDDRRKPPPMHHVEHRRTRRSWFRRVSRRR